MPSFFIVGSARSGTTMVRLMMNAHPEVAVPPESRFIVELWRGSHHVGVAEFLSELARHRQFRAWELPIETVAEELSRAPTAPFPDAIDAAFRAYARVRHKTRWGDKTPRYIEHIPFLAEHFPAARFIHIVRDGRNVALSYAGVPFGPKTVVGAAELWSRRVRAGMQHGRALGPGRYLELRYEDLATRGGLEPDARRLCDFLGLEFAAEILDWGARSADEALAKAKDLNPLVARGPAGETRAWQRQMPARHVEIFESVAGDALAELGYERRFPRPGPRARVLAALGRRGAPVGRLRRAERV
jgi:hypothetical protein